eukprot:CAMPEP_0176475996 /NCGR_PEP_ID=MMETSP0127-20121128/43906_1 /TAXON_ID=938130 /ORGANISM="Platyophrya macrostoma, Strain WH" /LENGTH=213 /DNA_ID=CAMNT_0017871633 /DNA_START=52 /DNA_END=689 /DNA_ORIENTATION=-
MTPMGIWINISSLSFQASDWTQTLTWGLAIQSSSDIAFLRAKSGPTNATYAVYSLSGAYAQQLLWDVYSSNSWLSTVGIVSAWEEAMPEATSSGETDTSLVVYRSSDGKLVFTINGLAWLISAIVCTIVVASDYLSLQNKEEVVTELHEQSEEDNERIRKDALRRQLAAAGYDAHQFKGAGPTHEFHRQRNPLETDIEVQSYTNISSDDDKGW